MEAMLHPHSAASPSAALAGRDAKFEGRAASTAPACSACGRTTAKFSKTQAKKKSMRRCIECVDNGVQASGGGLVTKPAAPSAQPHEIRNVSPPTVATVGAAVAATPSPKAAPSVFGSQIPPPSSKRPRSESAPAPRLSPLMIPFSKPAGGDQPPSPLLQAMFSQTQFQIPSKAAPAPAATATARPAKVQAPGAKPAPGTSTKAAKATKLAKSVKGCKASSPVADPSRAVIEQDSARAPPTPISPGSSPPQSPPASPMASPMPATEAATATTGSTKTKKRKLSSAGAADSSAGSGPSPSASADASATSVAPKARPDYRQLILAALEAGGKEAKYKGGNEAYVDKLLKKKKWSNDPQKLLRKVRLLLGKKQGEKQGASAASGKEAGGAGDGRSAELRADPGKARGTAAVAPKAKRMKLVPTSTATPATPATAIVEPHSARPAVVAPDAGIVDPSEPPTKKRKKAKANAAANAAAGAAATPATTPAKGAKPAKCDRCDGPHDSSVCPHFKKGRDKHPDAQKGKNTHSMGASGGNAFLPQGKVVRQPGDGSCLFHSMSYGLRAHNVQANAIRLRKEIAQFVQTKPNYKISDTPVRDWVKWDAGCSVQNYCARMSRGGWGGGIEMAACSRLKSVNVHVFERAHGGFKRISCFDCPGSSKTVHVLYCGGVHYDALVPQGPLRTCSKAERDSKPMGMGMGMGMGFRQGQGKKRKFGDHQHQHQQQRSHQHQHQNQRQRQHQHQQFGKKKKNGFGGGGGKKQRGGWAQRW